MLPYRKQAHRFPLLSQKLAAKIAQRKRLRALGFMQPMSKADLRALLQQHDEVIRNSLPHARDSLAVTKPSS